MRIKVGQDTEASEDAGSSPDVRYIGKHSTAQIYTCSTPLRTACEVSVMERIDTAAIFREEKAVVFAYENPDNRYPEPHTMFRNDWEELRKIHGVSREYISANTVTGILPPGTKTAYQFPIPDYWEPPAYLDQSANQHPLSFLQSEKSWSDFPLGSDTRTIRVGQDLEIPTFVTAQWSSKDSLASARQARQSANTVTAAIDFESSRVTVFLATLAKTGEAREIECSLKCYRTLRNNLKVRHEHLPERPESKQLFHEQLLSRGGARDTCRAIGWSFSE